MLDGPVPPSPLDAPLGQVLGARRTQREFGPDAVGAGDLAALLWAGYGVTGEGMRRATPSAGAVYPLRIGVAAGRVAGVAIGGYGVGTDGELGRVSDRDLRARLSAAAIGDQEWLDDAAAVIVIAADLGEIVEHFADQQPDGLRGLRYAFLEAGHATQNILLAATSLGLSAVVVGGFDDDAVPIGELGLAGMTPVALVAVGPAAPRS